MIFNTHSHLNDDSFIDLEEEVIASCAEKEITLLVVGYNIEMSERAIMLAEKYSNVYAAVGLHPTESDDYEAKFEVLKPMMEHHKVIAIGECGLDYYWDTVSPDIQKEAFKKQIEFSKAFEKPLIIHMRDAAEDTLNILKEANLPKDSGIMHCYSGSVEMVPDYLDAGMLISLAGPVTFKNAKVPKEVAKVVPIDQLLVETDDPWLTPTPFRGKQNRADYVVYVTEEIARLREMPLKELQQVTYNNALRLFKLED